ncbi:MAG TPA: hypothetical protein PKI19_00465 [Elusimicrobiales bacterium]|nr:hypothetical protein [Elusimicrobiales bacterium]
MKIGIVTYYRDPGHVLQRWRGDLLVKYLPRYGHSAEYYREEESYDLAIVPILAENAGIFSRICARGIPVIGEVTDDLLTFPYSYYSPVGRLYYRLKFNLGGRRARFREMLERSRHVVAGSEFQRKKFLAYNPNVSRLTDAVTPDILGLHARYDNPGPCRLAWFGNVMSLHGFKAMGDALDILAARGSYELVLIVSDYVQGRFLGAYPRTVHEFIGRQKIPCRHVQWSYEAQLRETAACDIGIVPVDVKEPFVAAKPSGRALLMMGLGLPVVAGPLDAYISDIPEGAGFIARTPGDWVELVEKLRADPALRENTGTRARQLVQSGFSEQAFAAKYAQIIDRVK